MTIKTLTSCPRLAAKARVQIDRITGEPVLLFPEGIWRLNRTAAIIIAACDGSRLLSQIVSLLASACGLAPERIAIETTAFLLELLRRRLILWDEEFSLVSNVSA